MTDTAGPYKTRMKGRRKAVGADSASGHDAPMAAPKTPHASIQTAPMADISMIWFPDPDARTEMPTATVDGRTAMAHHGRMIRSRDLPVGVVRM